DVVGCAKDKIDWHSRFGHPSENKLKALQKMYQQLDFIHPDHFDTCIMAKQRQLPYRSTNTRADKPLEINHTDICEAKNRGYDGSQYFVLLVDYFSRYTEVYTLKNKTSEAVREVFVDFKTRMERQFQGALVKKVRSD